MIVIELFFSFYIKIHVHELLPRLQSLLLLFLLQLLCLQFVYVVGHKLLLHQGIDKLLVLQSGPFFFFFEGLFVTFGVGIPLWFVPAGVSPEFDVLIAAAVFALFLFAFSLGCDFYSLLAFLASLN